MALVRVEQFGGMIPKLDPKRLPDNCAVEAINVNLRGHGIEPVLAPLERVRILPSLLSPLTATVVQIPTACFYVTVGASTGYAYCAPPLGNYTVVAGDELWYAVFLPTVFSMPGIGGQGAIDVQFTDTTTLGAAIVDQNAINVLSGDITTQAQGKWYLRKLPLAGQLASNGTPITGKIISQVRLAQNGVAVGSTPLTAYYGVAFVTNAGAFKTVLFDLDRQQEMTNTTFVESAGYTTIDEDDMAYVVSGGNSEAALESRATVALAQFSGYARQKVIVARGGMESSERQSVIGRANHDLFAAAGDMADLATTNWAAKGFPAAGAANDTAIGWVAVGAPTTAMTLAVLGGAAPVVTRSYVYTHVSEDGLESAPSPAVTVTGNESGTWQLTNIGTWPGTDNFPKSTPAGSLLHKRRIYRTPSGSSTYRFVAEIADNVTTLNDLALDAALGEDLPTASYAAPPALNNIAAWRAGMLAGTLGGTQVCICEPFQYHAWPLAYRYTVPFVIMALGTMGDRVVALTKGKPVTLSGNDPAELVQDVIDTGEACINAKAALVTDIGIIYPGRTGWGLISYGGYQNVTQEFLDADDYHSLVDRDTVALFDNRRLYWVGQFNSSGYAFEFGAGERSLTKWEIPAGTSTMQILALGYYGPRDTKWYAYVGQNAGGVNGSLCAGKLFADTDQKLKWTWKSKPVRFPKPVRLKVAAIDSNEWDTLSASMKAREAAYKTGGGGAPYSIDISGLTQAEPWCYLKVWCEADKGADAVLVYDDFVVSDRPVRLARSMKSDCWQFEIRGNMAISSIALAEWEKELNAE